MGYSSAEAQIRVIPVYLVATVVSLTTAWATDRFKCRYFFIVLLSVPGIAGYGILLGGTKVPNGGRYAACFLVTSSAMTVLPTVLAWVNYQVIPQSSLSYVRHIANQRSLLGRSRATTKERLARL